MESIPQEVCAPVILLCIVGLVNYCFTPSGVPHGHNASVLIKQPLRIIYKQVTELY